MANQISLTVEKKGNEDITNYTMLFTVSRIVEVIDNLTGTKGLVSYLDKSGEIVLYTVTELATAIKIKSDSVAVIDTEISVDTITEATPGLGVTIDGVLLKDSSVRNSINLGTTPVGTVSIVEYGDGRDITTVLTLTNFIVGALAGAGAALGVGNIVYAFPAGQHLELVSSFSSLSLTAVGTAVATKTGLGSVIASGAISVLSGTSTFQDRHTAQNITTGSGGGTAVSSLVATTAGIGTGIALNVAASVKNVFLNSAGTWNVNNINNLTASGTIIIKWTKMS